MTNAGYIDFLTLNKLKRPVLLRGAIFMASPVLKRYRTNPRKECYGNPEQDCSD